mmetsp:Transcript_30082/g.29329  ORF Transcript_30082/g.29329 Transcript_30082/m.29329 type:complete len:84 (+) Transcript_30082:256-507(+)
MKQSQPNKDHQEVIMEEQVKLENIQKLKEKFMEILTINGHSLKMGGNRFSKSSYSDFEELLTKVLKKVKNVRENNKLSQDMEA